MKQKSRINNDIKFFVLLTSQKPVPSVDCAKSSIEYSSGSDFNNQNLGGREALAESPALPSTQIDREIVKAV